MARRRELASTVHGLYGSFIGRNNDVDGYWGVGKLCLHAQTVRSNTVRIDLVDRLIEPPSSDFGHLVERYRTRLFSAPASRYVSSAVIELNFRPALSTEHHVPVITWGDVFQLTVTIIDDRGRPTLGMGTAIAGHMIREEKNEALAQTAVDCRRNCMFSTVGIGRKWPVADSRLQ